MCVCTTGLNWFRITCQIYFQKKRKNEGKRNASLKFLNFRTKTISKRKERIVE